MTLGRVLVVGVFLVDQANAAPLIVSELGCSADWLVDQYWIALGTGTPPAAMATVTSEQVTTPMPKFALINRELARHRFDEYDYVLIADDDIALPVGFLDFYLALVKRHDLALSQPARTHDSYIDHPFVEQLDGIDARWTRFVEIGPLVTFRRDVARLLLPFDESSPMGWGYDLTWPCVVEQHRLKMGIVDATPVSHSMRTPLEHYERAVVDAQMTSYLSSRPHLLPNEAFVILESYA